MERLEKILEIKVDVNDAIKGITDLNKEIDAQRQYQKRLQEQIKELSKDYAANAGEIEQLQQEMVKSKELTKDYSSQVQVLSRNVQNQLKVDRENVGSLKQLRAQLSNLTSAYDALSEEERNAAKGRDLKDKINEVTDSLKGAEEATQRYYRNVGNYENAIKNTIGLNSKFGQTLQNVAEMTKNGVGPALNEATTGVKNVGKETLKLLANPIVAILGAIAVAIMAVVKGIKSSEENMAKLKGITVSFKPILDIVTKAFQSFASVILDVAGFIGRLVGGISQWLEKAPMIGETIKHINEENARYVQLEKDKQKLVERNRKLLVDESDAELQVSELRVKAKEKEIYTDEERLKFVQEANEIERKIAEEKKAVAEENLRLLKEEAAATENTAEINDELARAEAEVNRATIAYNTKKRELLEQENTIKNEIAAKDKARADAADAENAKKLAKQKEYNDALEEATREAEDMFIELMEEGLEKEKEIERVRYERQKQAIEEKQAQYGKDTEIYQQYALQLERAAQLHNETLADLEKEYNKSYEEAIEEREVTDEQYLEHKKRMAELEKKIEDSKLREYSSIAGSISSILDATAGDNVKRVKAAKLAALAEIAINQGIAIAQAVTSVKGLVFPANLPAIAASVASALSALVPAIQSVNSVKLARGGRVSGAGTSTSDSVPAMLSNGEFVVNARATSMFPELLETINNLGLGLGAPARMEKVTTTRIERDNAEALIKALQQMPAPVVSVEEINRTGRRVEALERLSRLA
jgi:predicted  nucleic acid-binding Zn-ribbon protein